MNKGPTILTLESVTLGSGLEYLGPGLILGKAIGTRDRKISFPNGKA